MKNQQLEELLSSEMEVILGGSQANDTCICENGGAAATVIVVEPSEPTNPIRNV